MSSFQVVSGDEDIQMDRSVMMKIKKKKWANYWHNVLLERTHGILIWNIMNVVSKPIFGRCIFEVVCLKLWKMDTASILNLKFELWGERQIITKQTHMPTPNADISSRRHHTTWFSLLKSWMHLIVSDFPTTARLDRNRMGVALFKCSNS